MIHGVIKLHRFGNPGLWLLHCHFSWHLSSGLNMQFAQVSSQLPDLDIPGDVQHLLQHQCQAVRDTYGNGVTVTGVGKRSLDISRRI